MRRVLAAVACCSVARALHASLAYPSRLPLPPLLVKQFCIDCKNPEDDPTKWRNEIRKRAARCGCGYREGTAKVVFHSDPSRKDLSVLCGNDGTARQLEDTSLEPGDRQDWPVYDRLLLSDLSRHLRDHGVEKDYGLLWLPLAGETFEASKLVIKRGINVGLTTFVDTHGECRLLMPLNVKHKNEAKESICSMLKREPFDSLLMRNIKVKTRSGIYPSFSGTLCLPTTQGSISAPRAGLPNSQSLIEYSMLRDDRQGSYLKAEPDPNAVAVGLKPGDGYRRTFDSIDYPPQLLEPAFDYSDLTYDARDWRRLSPDEQRLNTTSIKDLVSNWRPGFLNLTQPILDDEVLRAESDDAWRTVAEVEYGYLEGIKLRDLLRMGPALQTNRDAELLPVYPEKYAAKVEQLVDELSPYFQSRAPSISVAPRDKWIILDDEGAWENQLRTLSDKSQEYAVLACFTNGEDRKRIKGPQRKK